MVPDVAVLSRLLDPSSPFNPSTAAAAAAAAASTSTSTQGGQRQPPTPIAGVVAAAAAAEAAGGGKGGGSPETKGQWKDSLRAINDVILRRHFADLTRCVQFSTAIDLNAVDIPDGLQPLRSVRHSIRFDAGPLPLCVGAMNVLS